MRAILDTSVVIALEMAPTPPDLTGFDEVAISSITYAQLEFGLFVAASEVVRAERQAALVRIRAAYGPGIPFDDHFATGYALLFGTAHTRGRRSRVRSADFQIAATAQLLGVPLVTRNTADLDVVGDLVELVHR